MSSNLLIFPIMDSSFGIKSKNSLLNPMSERFFSYLYFYKFITLHSTMIHYELIFVPDMRFKHRIFLCVHIDAQLFQYHHFCFSNIRWAYLCGSISGFSIRFHYNLFVYSSTNTTEP